MKKFTYQCVSVLLFPLLTISMGMASVPATSVMALYAFDHDLVIPFYSVDSFLKDGTKKPAGYLAQGSRVIPCILMSDDKPLTDANGTPYVGFEIILDADKASSRSGDKLLDDAKRETRMVQNHHCGSGVKHVISAKRLINSQKPPFFDPEGKPGEIPTGINDLDTMIRTFHNSAECHKANKKLTGRRDALANAWASFIDKHDQRWSREDLAKAKSLDYTMRTAIYEGHLGRGCNAYGACERNIIALSIRNRAVEQCLSRQGCAFPGDFQGVASNVSQYNIWDEYLSQTSGLTSCFLRTDLASQQPYAKLQAMYALSLEDITKIMFGDNDTLKQVFPATDLGDLKDMRHYYHPPAMGACYPQYENVEYISAAVANKGNDHILIANKRIKVDGKTNGGYQFREFNVSLEDQHDDVTITDRFNGFVIDARKVSLKQPSRCSAYGVSSSCRFSTTGRYRKTPFWLKDGKPVQFHCSITAKGEDCEGESSRQKVKVGGRCDVEMVPVSGVR